MGGSTKKIIKDVAITGAGFALGGPTGAALAFGATQIPKAPGVPGIPDVPTTDSAAELQKQRAIQDRILAATFTGQGRKSTIATGGQGVTKRASLRRQTLTGV